MSNAQSLKDLLAGKGPTSAPAAATAATPVVIPPGATQAETLKNTLASFAKASAAGGIPRVNPPEAAKVLATKTTNEVAGGKEEPELDGSEVEPPTSKPADVVAAENAPRTRRTAAVVQAELDAALEEIGVLKALARSEPDQKALREANEMIEALRAEAALREEDLKKAHARADATQEAADLAEQLGAALTATRVELEQVIGAKPGGASLALATTKQLADALVAQGFTVHLEVGPA